MLNMLEFAFVHIRLFKNYWQNYSLMLKVGNLIFQVFFISLNRYFIVSTWTEI